MRPVTLNDMIASYIVEYSISNSMQDYFEFNIEDYFDEETEDYIKDNYEEIANIIEENFKVLNVSTEDENIFDIYFKENYIMDSCSELVMEICNKYKIPITYEELCEIIDELKDKINANASNLIIEYLRDIGKEVKCVR